MHSRVAQTYKHLLTLYNLQEKLDESRDCANKALEVLRYIFGEVSIEVAFVYERLGDTLSGAGLRDEAKEFFIKARDIRVKILGEEHKDTQSVITLINGLQAPPPPPPPPPATYAVEELLEQANTEITTEMKAQRGRADLLDAIKNFGKMKEQLASAETVARKEKKAANLEEKKGWWKQNYKAGFDAKNVEPKKISASMLKDAKTAIMKPVPVGRIPPPPPSKK